MITTTRNTSFWLVALVFNLLACSQQQALPDCDCQSTTYSLLTDRMGIYSKGAVITIDTKTRQSDGSYALSCNPNFIIGKATDGDTIVLSGRARTSCFKGETFIVQPGLLELTAVRKK